MQKIKSKGDFFQLARRIGIIFSIFLLFNFAVFYKMYSIINDERTTVDVSYSSYSVEISQNRGTVFDRNGEPLTNNKTIKKAVFTPDALADEKCKIYLTETQIKTLENGYPVVTVVPENFSMTGVRVATIKSDDRSILPHILGYTNSDGDGVCGVVVDLFHDFLPLLCDYVLGVYQRFQFVVNDGVRANDRARSIEGKGVAVPIGGTSARFFQNEDGGGVIPRLDDLFKISV